MASAIFVYRKESWAAIFCPWCQGQADLPIKRHMVKPHGESVGDGNYF